MEVYVELLKENLELDKLLNERRFADAVKKYDDIIRLRSKIDSNRESLAFLYYKKGLLCEKEEMMEIAKKSFETALQCLSKTHATRLYQQIIGKLNSN